MNYRISGRYSWGSWAERNIGAKRQQLLASLPGGSVAPATPTTQSPDKALEALGTGTQGFGEWLEASLPGPYIK